MAVGKDEILDAIRRVAEENGGKAVGRERFERLTGITEGEWLGRHWARWGDAVTEAGYSRGVLNTAVPEAEVLAALAMLVRDLGRFPTVPELKMRKRSEPTFPSHNVFARFGGMTELAARLVEHCTSNQGLVDVAALAAPAAERPTRAKPHADAPAGDGPAPGDVYLMKSGRHYKLGRSNASGRRAYELAIQLPDRLAIVHRIETDDAAGIEAYWHRRFADRRLNGEWFALTPADVRAFRRRRFM